MLELDDCRDFPTHVSWDERIDLRQWKACGCTTQWLLGWPRGIPGTSQCAPSCMICITSGQAEGKDLAADAGDLEVCCLAINCLGWVLSLSVWETIYLIGGLWHFVYRWVGAWQALSQCNLPGIGGVWNFLCTPPTLKLSLSRNLILIVEFEINFWILDFSKFGFVIWNFLCSSRHQLWNFHCQETWF